MEAPPCARRSCCGGQTTTSWPSRSTAGRLCHHYRRPRETGEVAGLDLGEVPVAAITTSRRHALVLSGRLRSFKPWRNKSHARISEKLDRCRKGSRRSKRLVEAKA